VAFQGRAKPLVSVLAPGVRDASTSRAVSLPPGRGKRLLKELGTMRSTPCVSPSSYGNQDATTPMVAALIKNQMGENRCGGQDPAGGYGGAVDRVLSSTISR